MVRDIGFAVGVFLLTSFSFTTFAETPNIPTETASTMAALQLEDGSTLTYSRDPSVALLTWENWPEELRSEVPAETFEILGDGTVRVTFPDFRLFAGVYERRLTDEEFNRILTDVVLSRVAESDGRALKRQALEQDRPEEQPIASAATTAPFEYRTSDTITVVRSRLQVHSQGGTLSESDALSGSVFRYRGLELDAARHQDLPRLQAAARVQRALRSIAEELLEEAGKNP